MNEYSVEDKHAPNTYSGKYISHDNTMQFLFHVQPGLQNQRSQLPTGPRFQSQALLDLSYTGKSYCLQTLTPLNTVVLTSTLFRSLKQFNTLYADLDMGISNYWIHLDRFNKMLLEKDKQKGKEQLKMNWSSKKHL